MFLRLRKLQREKKKKKKKKMKIINVFKLVPNNKEPLYLWMSFDRINDILIKWVTRSTCCLIYYYLPHKNVQAEWLVRPKGMLWKKIFNL